MDGYGVDFEEHPWSRQPVHRNQRAHWRVIPERLPPCLMDESESRFVEIDDQARDLHDRCQRCAAPRQGSLEVVEGLNELCLEVRFGIVGELPRHENQLGCVGHDNCGRETEWRGFTVFFGTEAWK